MSNAVGVTVRIGYDAISTETGGNFRLTRQARARGMASIYRRWDLRADAARRGHEGFSIWFEEYGRVNLHDLRTALDNLTIEDSKEETVKIHDLTARWGARHFAEVENQPLAFRLRMANDGRVVVKMPCGESRRYKVRTLDKALTALGA
jgi:hypothetical protein